MMTAFLYKPIAIGVAAVALSVGISALGIINLVDPALLLFMAGLLLDMYQRVFRLEVKHDVLAQQFEEIDRIFIDPAKTAAGRIHGN